MRIPKNENATAESDRVSKEFERICNEEINSGAAVVIGAAREPASEFAKLLYVIVQEVGASQPMAFRSIDVIKALQQADRLAKILERAKR